MIINKVKVCNFGSFEGEIELNTSIDNRDKNIILIGGKNGAGKTTLFTAIKLNIYGPIAFGYDSTSTSYFRRIKRLINKNSLSKKDVNTYVALDFNLEEEREIANYKIERHWKYEEQKLVENLIVKRNDLVLSDEEVESFENYLKTLIPPQLFDLFFFDGEKISEFFLDGNSSKNLRDALLLLCGYDTFDIIGQNFKRIGHKKNNELLDEEERKISALNDEYNSLKNTISIEAKNLENNTQEIINLKDQLQHFEIEFQNAGGLKAQEIAKIKSDLDKEDKKREELNEELKSFANEALPFIITSNLIKNVKEQIDKENAYKKYITIKDTLNEEFLIQIIQEEVENNNIRILDSNNNDFSCSFSTRLSKYIDEKIKPDFDSTNFKIMHSLSNDEESELYKLIYNLEKNSTQKISEIKKAIANSIAKIIKLKKKLDTCEKNNDLLLNYSNKIEEIKNQIITLLTEKGRIEACISNYYENLESLEQKIKKADDDIKKTRKGQSVYLLSKEAYQMINAFIPVLINKKLEYIKSRFLEMFKQLISKQDYIHSIDIDNNFNVTLYRNSYQTAKSLINMITKIGLDAFVSYMGRLSVQALLKELNISSINNLESELKIATSDKPFSIPVKIDINGFSKGEQQIYIMSLYWALIKTSEKVIPFIIDTPYARIDSRHRERITTNFFPSLSSQVMILSTDEEINNEYYSLIKPFVSKEFLISYSAEKHCTTVEEKYFFEVDSICQG